MGLETDYVVVGAGAMGLAFADVIVEAGAEVVFVDRHARPGGLGNLQRLLQGST